MSRRNFRAGLALSSLVAIATTRDWRAVLATVEPYADIALAAGIGLGLAWLVFHQLSK